MRGAGFTRSAQGHRPSPSAGARANPGRGLLHVLPGALIGVLHLPHKPLGLLGILLQLRHGLLVSGAGFRACLGYPPLMFLDLCLPDPDLGVIAANCWGR